MQLERGNTHTDDSGQDKSPEDSLEVIKSNIYSHNQTDPGVFYNNQTTLQSNFTNI